MDALDLASTYTGWCRPRIPYPHETPESHRP